MSDTFNRPMFKRGPDGKMREAHMFGGWAGIPTLWRQALVHTPKFTNLPKNFNKAMHKLGVPTIKGAQRTLPGEIGKPVYISKNLSKNDYINKTFPYMEQQWMNKLNALQKKHGVSGFQPFKMMPEELKQHYRLRPKMPRGKRWTENIGYGVGLPMLAGWGPGYPDDPAADIAADGGASLTTPQEGGTIGEGVDESKTTYGTGIEEEGGPLTSYPVKSKEDIEKDPNDHQSIAYDDAQASDRQPGIAVANESLMPDIMDDAITMDDSISKESILKYKQELKDVIGEEDKTTGSLLLMQLGLGMMAGKSDQPGFAGFAEILGKTGQQVLPMFMDHIANKRKEDKEISLAAYEMLREDRAAKRKREEDLTDWVWKEDYKNIMNPPGTLANIMVKREVALPGGGIDTTWEVLKQTMSKSAEALSIIEGGNPNLRIVPLNISEAGMLAGGIGEPKGKWTDAQRGEHANLANTLIKPMGQILDFLMDPNQGLMSGNYKTGYTGRVVKGLRFITREAQQALDAIGLKNPVLGDMYTGMYGVLGESTALQMDSLVASGGIMPGAGNAMSEDHAAKGVNDIWRGTAMGANGQMVEGDYATEAYVRSLTDNSLYDIDEQLTNMMGFLMARLKQPTGRLLADTIQSSIREQAPLGGMKDPVQAANQLHLFVKTLYESYARSAAIGGVPIETQWQGRSGPLTIQNYEKMYQMFTGDQRASPPIDFSFIGGSNVVTPGTDGNIYPGQENVKISGPQDLTGLLNKWTQ